MCLYYIYKELFWLFYIRVFGLKMLASANDSRDRENRWVQSLKALRVFGLEKTTRENVFWRLYIYIRIIYVYTKWLYLYKWRLLFVHSSYRTSFHFNIIYISIYVYMYWLCCNVCQCNNNIDPSVIRFYICSLRVTPIIAINSFANGDSLQIALQLRHLIVYICDYTTVWTHHYIAT